MADPLSVAQGPVPSRVSKHAADKRTTHLRQLWSDIFHAQGQINLASLKQKGVKGKIPVGQDPNLRWIHWKLYLSDCLSNTPSSWTAVMNKDRSQYVLLRRSMLRAPDGNYPPDIGLDDEQNALEVNLAVRASISSGFNANGPNVPARGYHETERSLMGDLSVNNPLSLDDSNPWKAHYASMELRQVIAQDVERTFPEIALFREAKVQKALTNALFIWCKQNEDVGYRQGMHELMAVLWAVRHQDSIPSTHQNDLHAANDAELDLIQILLADKWVEHDVYALFCDLMRSAKIWFEWKPKQEIAPAVQPSAAQQAVTPIVSKCEGVRDLLRTADPRLAQHLDSLGIEPQLFVLRWIKLMFTREFPLDDAIRIWDGLFATDKTLALIDYICIAMLLRVRNDLLCADYATALQTLLRYPVASEDTLKTNHPELLVQQAIYLRDHAATPTAGVAVIMQNHEVLGIVPKFDSSVDRETSSDHAVPSLASQTSSYSTSYQPRAPKFATVGRAASGASPFASWQRSTEWTTSPQRASMRSSATSTTAPASAPGMSASASNRSLGIVPSSYIPEGISDFARGLYEKSDSLGINRALGTTMANVQRTVAAAAAGVSGPASGYGTVGSGGFPTSIDQSWINPQGASVEPTADAAPTARLNRPRHHVSASLGRFSGPEMAAATSERERKPSNSNGRLDAVTSSNKAISEAISVCVDVLERSWLSLREGASIRDDKEDVDQNDANVMMSFTALKHIRDVLSGTAQEFDPATLPPKDADTPSTPATNAQTRAPSLSDRVKPTQLAAGHASLPAQPSSAEVLRPKTDHLPLALAEYLRYGRQMILPDFGLQGQLLLRKSKVLVVGAGGLGCPAIQYLAAAGVGEISILDHDVVEPSNLARQILHTDERVGMSKAESAAQAARIINPHIKAIPHAEAISSANARTMIAGQDLVLDCTDNPLTRYLISDAAVLEGVQVVSGAAQGYDGQLMVLHKRIKAEFAGPAVAKAANGTTQEPLRGPCYRCLFPVAPKPEDVTDCEDGGVLGGVTGLVGTMQALESVKILANLGEATPPLLTLVGPMSSTPFRTIKLRPRRLATCRSCGDPAQVGADKMITDLEKEDYVSFCGLRRPDADQGATFQRVKAKDVELGQGLRVIDVRPQVEFDITHLKGSINLPMRELQKDPGQALTKIQHQLKKPESHSQPVLVVCRKGNDSQVAVRLLSEAAGQAEEKRKAEELQRLAEQVADPLLAPTRERDVSAPLAPSRVDFTDLVGGLRAYSKEKDSAFPMY